MKPLSYMKNNRLMGYEVDLATRFCKEYGYGPHIQIVEFPTMLAGLEAGKYDIGAGGITVSDERAEKMNFTDPTYTGGVVVAVAGVNISGVAVSVVAFAINFAAYVSEMMRTGIEAVNKGQWEAAQALDYDFIGQSESIRRFGEKNLLGHKRVLGLQTVYEEILAQSIVPRMGA